MAKTSRKINGANRAPTTIRRDALHRMQCVKQHLSPVPGDINFISEAVDARVRQIMRRHRVTLPAHCAFAVPGPAGCGV